MKISDVKELLEAEVLVGEDQLDEDVFSACGCDMMSDVLAYVKDQAVLMTGLVSPQVVRTAAMMDMVCIVFVRSKKPTQAMLELAKSIGLVIMTSNLRLYEACGRLYLNGLRGDKAKENV